MPFFFLGKPDPVAISRVLSDPRCLTPTYRTGAFTLHTDHNRILLGHDCFEAAREALQEWRMFDLGWIRIAPETSPIAEGTIVAPVIRHLGFWSVNPAQIVKVIDEPRRFGFTYATLSGHAECGEEQFLVEWLPNGEVWYDLHAVSRPRHPLAWLGYPISRALQKKFARESLRAIAGVSAKRS